MMATIPAKSKVMPTRVVRSDEEIEECRGLARVLTDKAEARGSSDDAADAIYEFIQWLFGDSDTHPSEGYLEPDVD